MRSFRARVATSASYLPFVAAFAFRCHPEERSDEVRFSIARLSRDESLLAAPFPRAFVLYFLCPLNLLCFLRPASARAIPSPGLVRDQARKRLILRISLR